MISLDFRKNGFLIKKIFIFDEITYILTSDVPKKSCFKNFDLKITVKNKKIIIESRNNKLNLNSLKTNIIESEEDIFFSYLVFQIYLSGLSVDLDFNTNFISYKSKSMNECIFKIKNIARTSENVLIFGQTGTGKELLARLIHFNSKSKDYPFLVYNCGFMENDFDFEGVKKGAFTSLTYSSSGLFKKADKGILVLDGAEHLSFSAQSNLLRLVENKAYKKIGTDYINKSDVRIISIFNENPFKLIDQGKLKSDFFYRLSAFVVEVPSLIDRTDDLNDLINFFTKDFKLTYRAFDKLINNKYIGNLRELISSIDRAKVLARGSEIDISHIYFHKVRTNKISKFVSNYANLFYHERAIINSVLQYSKLNISKASLILGIRRSTLIKKIKELQIL